MSNVNSRNTYPASSGRNLVQVMSTWLMLVLLTLDSTFGFNFDQRAPLVFDGPSGSLFGFSVAQHRDANTDWVLIGAPKASTNQVDVVEGGAVYKCPVVPLGNLGACEQVPFDITGQEPVTNKSHQWFGATVESSGPDGRILACAPRLVWYRTNELAERLREPTGTCFVGTSDFGNFEEYSPCQSPSGVNGFEGITHCLAGFSAQIPKDNSALIIGTPGSYFLQGQVYSQSLSNASVVISTEEGALTFDNSYRGFSLALGDFNGDGKEDYVTGTPRGSSLMGLVSIFDSQLNSLIEVTGEQLVSYFGNSVEAVDVNGDGRDDLIVGAPMHTDKSTANEKWEAGQVYVYLQTPAFTLGEPVKIIGQATRARFGYSVASIGDANQDGFNDIAVGAPFDGEAQSGLVYIYHGKSTGLGMTPSQVISPTSLGQTGMSSFGFSLQGGQDMDGNNYPDLLVGAESSDKAVLIRTRPVVLLNAELTLDPIGINLDNKTLLLGDGSMVTGFLVVPCLTYTGNHLPSEIAITYMLTLDSRVGSSSRALLLNGQSTMTVNRRLQKGQQFCDSQQAYVMNAIQDKLTPIAVTLNYELNQDESSLGATDILPILNVNAAVSTTSKTQQVYIQNNCANNLCIPELAIQATSRSTSIVVGSGGDLTLDVTVDNRGDDAFQSTLDVFYPEGLQYVRLERPSQMDLSVTCTDDPETRIISCDTGNPLSGRYMLEFGLTLSTSGVTGNREALEFYMIAKSENSEDAGTLDNNKLNMTVDVAVQVNLKLLSASDPELVTYEVNEDGSIPVLPSNASEKDIGPAITHLYEVRNAGPSQAGRIEMDIDWPQRNDAGDYFFYLLGLNAADGMACSFTQGQANPDGIHLEQATQSQLTPTTSSRKRREAAAAAAAPVAQSQTQSEPIYCSGEGCVKIHCTIDQLVAGESKVVRLLGRVWSRTFMQLPDAASQIVAIASSASAVVQEVPYNISFTPGEFSDTTKASTTVSSEELQAPPASIAWWIILVSVLGGLILLLIIILGLWKCGFFERKTPGEEKKSKYEPVAVAPSAPEKTGLGPDSSDV